MSELSNACGYGPQHCSRDVADFGAATNGVGLRNLDVSPVSFGNAFQQLNSFANARTLLLGET